MKSFQRLSFSDEEWVSHDGLARTKMVLGFVDLGVGLALVVEVDNQLVERLVLLHVGFGINDKQKLALPCCD